MSHEERLHRMARAAGFELVNLVEHRRHLAAQDAISAVCISQARLMRAALVEVRALLETALPTATEPVPRAAPLASAAIQAVRVISEALDPVPFRVVDPAPTLQSGGHITVRADLERPPVDVVRPAEAIIDHSEAGQ